MRHDGATCRHHSYYSYIVVQCCANKVLLKVSFLVHVPFGLGEKLNVKHWRYDEEVNGCQNRIDQSMSENRSVGSFSYVRRS